MSYKTILVHVDQGTHNAERVNVASRLAIEHDAHLMLADMTGLSRFALTNLETGGADPVVNSHRALLHERAHVALDAAEKLAQQAGVNQIERRVVDDEAGAGIALQARYADLVVISQDDPDEPVMGSAENFAEFAILNCAKPVLVLPRLGRFPSLGQRIMLGWNGSRESTRAIVSSLPLLQRAAQVQVAMINPGADIDVVGGEPGADIALYLARHGVKVETVVESAPGDAGEALLSLATDRAADMLVMGAYGHSRFREILLGGVTRKLLASMTLPVLFAH